MGIKTTLITGPTNIFYQKGIQVIKVVSADEMFEAVKKTLPVDIAICTAAVTDYKPLTKSKNKIKKY